MRVVLTAAAHERWWPRLERPGVEPLILGVDGGLVLASGAGVARDEADPEVAWGTSDLFDEGAPLRPFFGLLRRSSTLRWFQSPAAGYDGAVFGELARRGVRVSNAHVNGIPIAEYVLRAVLDHFQDAGRWRAGAEARGWRLHDFREVYGTTWLVVGLGSIGGAVATRARAFGARVIGCRRRPSPDDPADETVTPERLLDVVGAADVVVLSAPATATTVGLVDAAFLGAMKAGSLLVNVARGSLVDEDALLVALERGAPEAAVLDVFAAEPLASDHPFWDHPAVTITPHNAAGGTGRHVRQAELFAENLDRYLGGRPLLNEVTDVIRAEAGTGGG
jgi:phosphoglycerate dehydrogenase-like enzyme